MSPDVAIQVRGLSKRYRIGGAEDNAETLVQLLSGIVKQPLRNLSQLRRLVSFNENGDDADILWALRDVSFDVSAGEVVGVVGSNGAGKSTLLKLLTRITEPSEGEAKIYGRVGSLLEVGTGFHPELSGRDNIYMNGIVLGMSRREIDRKFNEIVEFSGVSKFLNTPVKRYSSGMKVRLAFSVAAHLEPEVLLIDEVLAVGDAAFQAKCLGKMGSVAKEGRTIIFVSHNMAAVTNLCGRVIWLQDGRIRMSGPSNEVVQAYLTEKADNTTFWRNADPGTEGSEMHIETAEVLSEEGKPIEAVTFKQSFLIKISYEVFTPIPHLSVLCRIRDTLGNVIWTSWDTDTTEWKNRTREKGKYTSVCRVPGGMMRPGRHILTVGGLVNRLKACVFHENVISFDVSVVDFPLNADRVGILTPLLEWDVKRLS